MATGRLGAEDLLATTYTTVYTVPTDTFTVAAVSICNRNATDINVRIGVTPTAGPSAPGNAEFIEYDVTISGNGVLERTGIVMDAGKTISVYSDTANVSAVVFGIETATA